MACGLFILHLQTHAYPTLTNLFQALLFLLNANHHIDFEPFQAVVELVECWSFLFILEQEVRL